MPEILDLAPKAGISHFFVKTSQKRCRNTLASIGCAADVPPDQHHTVCFLQSEDVNPLVHHDAPLPVAGARGYGRADAIVASGMPFVLKDMWYDRHLSCYTAH
jgi:hypothetical protein